MCGISGFFGKDANLHVEFVNSITDTISHRGPDFGTVVVVDQFLILGHRRLAIIDLSSNGNQPMYNASKDVVIVYNGELYNFKDIKNNLGEFVVYNGSSDTEVLLNAIKYQGINVLKSLNGMFAFGYYDVFKKSLLLVRDSVGIKPLYYSSTPFGIFFSSEAKAIEKKCESEPNAISKAGLEYFLTFGCLGEKHTIVEGISQVESGTYIQINKSFIDNNDKHIGKYFNKLKINSHNAQSFENCALTLRKLLIQSFQDQLISDVPIGLFLSSGVDSTILAGMAKEVSADIHTFTVCFDDIRNSNIDEGKIAATTAREFGLQHSSIVLREDQAIDYFNLWLNSLDQPTIDGLNTFIISKAVRDAGIKVALSGLGADELFGGYNSFFQIQKWSRIFKWTNWIPKTLGRLFIDFLCLRSGDIAKEKMYDALYCKGNVRELYKIRRGLFGKRFIKNIIGSSSLDVFSNLPDEDPDPIREVQRLELSVYMKNMLLRDTDVCSMAHGLEVRVPYLDQRIVDFALSLPGKFIAPKGKPGKWLLRQAMSKYLREEVVNQPKRGFVLPVGKWLKGPLRNFAVEILSKLRCIPQDEVQTLWKQFLSEKDGPLQSRIVGLLALSQVESRILS